MPTSHLFRVLFALLLPVLLAGQQCTTMPPSDDGADDGGDVTPPDNGGDDGDDGGTDGGDGETTTGSQALFDQAWSDFNENYSYFEYKGIDWSAVRAEHRPNFASDLSPTEFASRLNDMLSLLHDWHVYVLAPGGEPLGFGGAVETNFPPTLLTSYTQDGSYTTVGDNVIFHAWVGFNTAHIVIDTLESGKFSSVSDADIEAIFDTYFSADGMIIDIRNNSGGNENNAIKIASRLTDVPVTYGYVQTRNGPNHDDFDALVEKVLEPDEGTHFDGMVVGLIGQRCLSSAEWFTLMINAAGGILIGDTTRGGSGNPKEFALSNGVTYAASTWVAYTDEMMIFEDVGIEPLLPIPADESFTETRDFVLEEALALIEPF